MEIDICVTVVVTSLAGDAGWAGAMAKGATADGLPGKKEAVMAGKADVDDTVCSSSRGVGGNADCAGLLDGVEGRADWLDSPPTTDEMDAVGNESDDG